MPLFLIRTGKPTLVQLNSRNEYNCTVRLGLPKKIRNRVKAGKIYNRSKGNISLPVRSLRKCLSSCENSVLQTPVSVLSSERGTDSWRCGLGKMNTLQLVAEWCAIAPLDVAGAQVAFGGLTSQVGSQPSWLLWSSSFSWFGQEITS